MIVCETLGPPVVRLDDGSAPASLQWHKNLALLVYLARSPKRARGRDHLIGLLWGDEAEKDARHSLNQAVSTLRTYAGETIETDRTHVRLTDGAVSLPAASSRTPVLDELEWERWLAAEPRGYGFVARIVRDVVDRDMVVSGQRRRILEAAGRSPAA